MDKIELSEQIDRSIKARMARQVLPGPRREIDPRTGFVLKIADVLRIELPNQMPDQVVEILLDPNHPDRVFTAAGPALVFRATEHEHQFMELEVALLNPDARVRSAVLDELSRNLSSVPELCSDKVRRIILAAYPQAGSNRETDYLRACLTIHDALQSDILYNLALLAQACASGALESASEYVDRLLRPIQRGFSCFEELPFIGALSGASELGDLFTDIIRNESVEECLANYSRLCGFLPLAGIYSCGSVLDSWRTSHADVAVGWQSLADWADKQTSALAQYQICQAVVSNQDLIDDASSTDINQRINSMILAGDSDDRHDSWVLRHHLSRYYCQYLTCEFAAGDTERMAICAWWLADRLTRALDTPGGGCREECIQRIADILDANEELWLMVQPGGEPSMLFSATMQHRHLWSESLAAEIAANLVESGFTKLLPSTVSNMTQTAVAGALFPHGTGERKDRLTYSFELDPLPFVQKMLEIVGDTDRTENVRELVRVAETARSSAESIETIRAIPELADDVARVVTFALQRRAYAGGAPVEMLWNCILDPNWRSAVVRCQSHEAFSRLCETMLRIQATVQNEEWRVRLPHIFAVAALDDGGSEETVAALVSYCVVASIAGSCSSAIDRLVASERQDILSVLRNWHTRLDGIIRFARPLAASRLRPVKQSLSAAALFPLAQ